MTADDIIIALTPSGPVPAWVQQAALLMHPNEYNKIYETTAVNFFPETTVRRPQDGRTRRGRARFQRRRMDLVALVQPHYKQWNPVVIGVEIKVSEADLAGDNKLYDYLHYCHLFYLAVPHHLYVTALAKIESNAALECAGLLLVDPHPEPEKIVEARRPAPIIPDPADLAGLYAELLLRPFKKAKKTCKNFYEFAQTERSQT